MEYEEYTKRYCDNCVNKDCTRIPVNNDGSLIEKESPNICRYFKKVTDIEKIVERLEEVAIILKVRQECELRDGKCKVEDIVDYAERYNAINKAMSIVKYISDNDLLKRDDVYNFLEHDCRDLREAIDSLYDLDKIDLNYLDRVDVG